jgi:hypothetical protein
VRFLVPFGRPRQKLAVGFAKGEELEEQQEKGETVDKEHAK